MSDNKYEDDDIEIIYWGDGVKPPVKYVEEEVKQERRKKREFRQSKKQVKKEFVIVRREVYSWIKLVVCAVVLAYVISNYIIVNATVPTSSMKATIQEGDRMIGFRLSYVFGDVKRGDVIIFKFPDDEKQNFVKRVIGLPGETIEILNGKVYINDSETPLDEPYLFETPTGYFPRTEIPEGCYFVMGDNRNKSHDSRYWSTTHFVEEKKILGKAVCVYWPFSRMEIIE